jgi:pimeloyl-ACP methyl ester carboxylesterase
VDYVLSRGYHTLSYDRLGFGNSSHGDAKNEIQAFLEVEALAQLTRMVRNGKMCHIKTPTKIVHVGHSFGSAQTVALSAMYPNLSDALVLTGYSTSADYMPMFLSGANFQQARLNGKNRDYTAGYLTTGDIGSNVYLFFYPPHFDTGLLKFAEDNKQPMTIGELLTITGLPAKSNFTGPVYVIDGANDVAFCGGDCLNAGGKAASIPAGVNMIFPLASAFSAYVHPNTGHAINLHYNATGAYKQINDFLGAHGLLSTSHQHDHARHHQIHR